MKDYSREPLTTLPPARRKPEPVFCQFPGTLRTTGLVRRVPLDDSQHPIEHGGAGPFNRFSPAYCVVTSGLQPPGGERLAAGWGNASPPGGDGKAALQLAISSEQLALQ
jgi:hypothetical protein